MPNEKEVNDMNSNLRKMLTIVFLTIMGTQGMMAQTGKVTRKIYYTAFNGKPDTCYLTLSFKEGKVEGLNMSFNHKGTGSYLLATNIGIKQYTYKSPETKINDFRNLIDTLQTKFEDWSATAKKNNIVGYRKQVGVFNDVPILWLFLYRNGIEYYQQEKWPTVRKCAPIFEVDSNGNSSIFFGWTNVVFERVSGYNERVLYSQPITEQVVESNILIQFKSAKDIQSLKDALNIETARQELVAKKESNKDIDALFK